MKYSSPTMERIDAIEAAAFQFEAFMQWLDRMYEADIIPTPDQVSEALDTFKVHDG